MSIHELLALVPPPDAPTNPATDEARQHAETSLGIKLPDDLFDIGRLYGTGRFSNGTYSITIDNIGSSNYVTMVRERNGTIAYLKKIEGQDYIPFDSFPAEPGLFSIGYEINGDGLYWLTARDRTDWPIMIFRRHDGAINRFEGPITSFLAAVFSGSPNPHPWPEWTADPKQPWRFIVKKPTTRK